MAVGSALLVHSEAVVVFSGIGVVVSPVVVLSVLLPAVVVAPIVDDGPAVVDGDVGTVYSPGIVSVEDRDPVVVVSSLVEASMVDEEGVVSGG